MVRNPRMLVMCGLLAAATALALGGGAVPVMQGGGPSAAQALAMMVPGLGLWSSRAWVDANFVHAPAAVPGQQLDAPPARSVDIDPAPLDGVRQPRQPRMPRESRDALDR